MQLPAFYPILDFDAARGRGIDPIWMAREIMAAGARILQFRHKGFFSREVYGAMGQIAELCRAEGAQFVINDRADLARLYSAALHLGQDDLPPQAARLVTGEDLEIGFSTHNEPQLRAALSEPVDYVALGPIFGTSHKQNPDPEVGLSELRRLRALTARPLVAIGGITRANARAVLYAGADSVAVIGDLFPDNGDVHRRVSVWLDLVS